MTTTKKKGEFLHTDAGSRTVTDTAEISDMKTFIIRLGILFFILSLTSMFFWQYFTDSPTDFSNLQKVQEQKTTPEHKTVHETPTQNAVTHKEKENSPADFSNLSKVQEKKTAPGNRTFYETRTQNAVIHKEKEKVEKSDVDVNKVNKVLLNASDSKEIVFVKNLLANYTYNWKKQEMDFKTFRSMLNSNCNAIPKALVTQENSPVGTNITYDADRRKTVVKQELFNVFPKDSPFKTAPWDSCAVVGNGGILAKSNCGKQIDSASFVIRCNLPPLSNSHKKDTGHKTSLVTANPSIITQRYQSLVERRQTFVDDMQLYKDALLCLPAFSYAHNTALSLRAFYSLEELKSSGPRAVFFNPVYLKSLAKFWREQGIRAGRLSTGIMLVSLALEVCNNVHLYGFWPFLTHPYTYQTLSNHYYDDKLPKKIHNMPAEFKTLLNLHNRGVIHLHLGECTN